VVDGDPLRHVRHVHVLADREAAPLLDVAGDPLGGAGGDGRAQDDRLALAQERQQGVDRAADLRDVDLDVHVRGRAQREHDLIGLGGVLDPLREPQAVAGQHALEQLLGAGLVERHLAGAHGVEHARLAVHADHVQAPVGEGQRERQTDAAEPHDRYVRGHGPEAIRR
jgi:hypothetical protein